MGSIRDHGILQVLFQRGTGCGILPGPPGHSRDGVSEVCVASLPAPALPRPAPDWPRSWRFPPHLPSDTSLPRSHLHSCSPSLSVAASELCPSRYPQSSYFFLWKSNCLPDMDASEQLFRFGKLVRGTMIKSCKRPVFSTPQSELLHASQNKNQIALHGNSKRGVASSSQH